MKKLLVCLLSIGLISCSMPILENTNQYSDLDKEYSQFTTKALTQSYLKKKMDKWLSDGKYSKNLVREIEYAKFKHKDLLKDIVALQPTMYTSLTANSGIITKRSDATFENYIEYIDPFPANTTALNATNITRTSFTAHWGTATNATNYKLFVDGNEVYSGTNTSYDVTSLTAGVIHNYYVKALNSSGTSSNSNTISVDLTIPFAKSATTVTSTSLIANWDSVSNIKGYKLYVDELEGNTFTPKYIITILGSNTTNYTLSGLTANATHRYYLKTIRNDDSVSDDSNIVIVNVSIPVTNTATNIATTSFTANWGSVTNATSYKLFVDGTEVYSGANTNCNITGLTAVSTHTYYVQAINAGGISSNSNISSVTLKQPISCLDWKNAGATTDGVYAIDQDNSISTANINAYCNMTTEGGGWTMVVANYEADAVSWNEGIQADYDPSLATRKGFSLNTSQLPSDRTQTAFGKDLLTGTDGIIDYVNFVYSTGNIPVTSVTGIKYPAKIYKIHRDTGFHYADNDPERETDTIAGWNNTLTFEQSYSGTMFTWSFIPYQSSTIKGYAYNGAYLKYSSESYAWTVWVR